jgi:lysophospholipase L1-like esterase
MSSFEEAPDIIMLHCGGNDLGQHSIGDLRELAKSQLQYAAHQILFASLSNVKLDPPCLVLACSQAPFIMEDPKIQTDEKPEMIDGKLHYRTRKISTIYYQTTTFI